VVAAAVSTPSGERRLNLYEVLQISSSACPEVVHAAYRALARTYHPDVNPVPDAARKMQQLNAAYKVLCDPERRARYDAIRTRPMRARREPVPVTPNASDKPLRVVTPVRIDDFARRQAGGGPRFGRVLFTVAFMLLLIAALAFGVWLAAGFLDDEPIRAMSPNALGAVLASVR
jgi:curved DNA-binding protein CbpA